MQHVLSHSLTKTAIIGFFSGIIGASVFATFYYYTSNAPERRIAEYYETENAVLVSPHSMRKDIASGKYLLVDLRSAQEYETEHFITSINIPAYADPDTSDYGAVDRIVTAFKDLKEQNPDKTIVVYCYSTPCMTGRKIGKMLADHGIFVKHLGIGWNELKYHWDDWNHDGEKKVNPKDYFFKGKIPGEFKGVPSNACPAQGGATVC